MRSPQPFATVWKLLPSRRTAAGDVKEDKDTESLDQKEEKTLEEHIFWYEEGGALSPMWWELVGSLYYWRVRRDRPEFCDRVDSAQTKSGSDTTRKVQKGKSG